MQDTLSSLETEYGFAALDRSGRRMDPGTVARLFTKALQRQYPWLPAADGGCFLGNGARVYWDAGAHPEYAAPECAGHPRHLVAHVRAGHAIMSRTARIVEKDRRVGQIRIWRGNVDYLTGASWGCHENYLTRQSTAALSDDLLPHLASRVIYGGAGGWSPHDHGRFSLSPRLELFDVRESLDTMHTRGMINTRNEPHARAHRRLHLICRDSVTSQLADLLSVGMTRLVVALADMDLRPAQGLRLDDPVGAMHAFCRDTTCRERADSGAGPVSAVEIQRRYLEQIDANVHRLPEWSGEIARLCGSVLDELAVDPRRLCGKLDWPTKLVIFEGEQSCDRQALLMQDLLLSDLSQTLLTELNERTGSEVVSGADIETAITDAPSTTRARVRGEVVKRLSGRRDAFCNWSEIRTRDQRLALDEPFESRERWRASPVSRRRSGSD